MEEQAFRDLFASHYRGIYRLLYRIIGIHQEVEDVLQESFVRLHDRWNDIEPTHRKSWVYQVATHLGLNHIRDQKRRRRWHEEAALWQQQSDTHKTRPDHTTHIAVQQAMLAMPERQAQLLMLYASGLHYDELATAIQVQKTSLSQLLARAKKSFEQAYGTTSAG